MQIQIDHKGSDAFYTETVNVIAQYRRLLKKPERKIENLFQTYRLLGIACVVMFFLMLAITVAWGSDTTMKVLMSLMAVLFALETVYLSAMNKTKKRMMEDARSSVLTLDENGVELNKEDSQVVRLAWDNVAFVRVFAESIGFVSRDASGLIIFVEKCHESKIAACLREIAPVVPYLSANGGNSN